MAQYYVYKKGSNKFRDGVRGGYKVRDIAISPLAFAGAEDTDWKCIKSTLLPTPTADNMNITTDNTTLTADIT